MAVAGKSLRKERAHHAANAVRAERLDLFVAELLQNTGSKEDDEGSATTNKKCPYNSWRMVKECVCVCVC